MICFFSKNPITDTGIEGIRRAYRGINRIERTVKTTRRAAKKSIKCSKRIIRAISFVVGKIIGVSAYKVTICLIT